MSSFFSGGGGGRTRYGNDVVLNVYDISPANESVLNALGLGFHHSGVVRIYICVCVCVCKEAPPLFSAFVILILK